MNELKDVSRLKILEVGGGYFKQEYPERTTLLWNWSRLPEMGEEIAGFATPDRVAREVRSARDGKYDVIIANPVRYSPWHPRYWARQGGNTPTHPWASLSRQFGVNILRWLELPVPLIVTDMDDAFGIGRSTVFLLDKAKLFYKRELPVDRWQILYGAVHPHLPTSRYRHSEKWIKRMEVLRPISMPQFRYHEKWKTAAFPEKTHDIFFIGAVRHNSTVRSDGLAELRQLEKMGYRIDEPSERLPYDAFMERMSKSWIAWSPEGLGWDCNRHYEAAMVQSVPLTNHPTILRHAPLLDGVHGLYYDAEPGGLVRAAVAALADKDRLQRIAKAARDHAFTHHTRKAYCDFILRSAVDDKQVEAEDRQRL